MTYTVKYSERNLKKSSEFETKTLLFMLALEPNRSKVHYIFIDFFNDVTGSNKKLDTLWDYQSKGVLNMTPRKIGKSLATLYENFISNLNFSSYTIFMPRPNSNYLVNSEMVHFGIDNFNNRYAEIFEGLKAEFYRRNPQSVLPIFENVDQRMDDFLNKVTFAIDHESKSGYVKDIINFKNKEIQPEALYEAIFDEIKVRQISKKMDNNEGVQIADISDAIIFKQFIKTADINVLIVNRLIGFDIFKRTAIPIQFDDEVSGLDKEDKKDLIEDCCAKISRALFDKNAKKQFWDFFERAIIFASSSPSLTPREIYERVEQDAGIKSRHLIGLSGIFLIALIQEGLTI